MYNSNNGVWWVVGIIFLVIVALTVVGFLTGALGYSLHVKNGCLVETTKHWLGGKVERLCWP